MNSFLKRWLSDSTTTRAAARPRKLGMEHLEDRVTPTTTILDLPDAMGPVQVGSQLTVPGGYNPTTVQNPIRPDQIVTVSTTGSALRIAVSSDRGQTWANQSPATAFRVDPTTLSGNNRSNFTVVDEPSAAFDGNDTLYVAYIQRNAVNPSSAGTSGVLVVDRFRLSAGGGVTRIGTQQLIYQWVNQDPVFNPVVGVNDLVSSYTDPTSGQTVANRGTGRGVYVAWNTSATQTGFGDPQQQYIAPSIIQMAVSDDGGQSFSTPQFVTDNGFQVGARLNGAGALIQRDVGVDPQVYFTQRSVTNAIATGVGTRRELGFSWVGGKNTVGSAVTASTLTTDKSTPFTSDAALANPLTIQMVNTPYTNPTPVNPGRPEEIAGAITPPGGVLTAQTTTFEKTVDLTTTPGFTTLADLNVTLSVFSQDLGRMSITLIAPDGTSIDLLRSRQLLNGAGNLFSPGPNPDGSTRGLPGGSVQGLGEVISSIGNNQFANPAVGIVFDDEAARRINDPANLAPYILSVRPEDFVLGQEGGLSRLYGNTAAQLSGVWQLVIVNYKANDTSSPPIERSALDQWDMKFVSRVNTTGFGTDQSAPNVQTAPSNPTNIGTSTLALPTSGVQGWYSLAVDDSAGAFSPYQGRVYVAYTSGAGNDTNVFLSYSDNGGSSWSFPTRVNDDTLSDGFSGGNRAQFQPTVTVDPTTGTVVVMWYDARWDASNARPATFIATSVDGGNTFSPNTFLNFTKSATDAIDRTTVKIEPVPNNLASATTSFGNRQGLVAYDGVVIPVWTGNANTGGLGLMSAVTRIASGPRVLQGDSGPVADDFSANSNAGAVAYNNVFSVDGTRQLNAFYVRFDRAVDPATFTAADIKLMYRDTTGAAAQDISNQVLSVTPLDSVTPLNFGATVLGATRFLVTLTPQTRVGTYSYSVGPDISDRVRTVQNRVFQAPLLVVGAFGTNSSTINIPLQAPINLTSAQVNVRFVDPALAADASDMILRLYAPNGNFITLSTFLGNGTVGTAFANTTFDDAAAQFIFNANSPFGTVRPDGGTIQSLPDTFSGLRDISGGWQLEVDNFSGTSAIQLANWSITFNGVTYGPSTTTDVFGNSSVSRNIVLAGESPIVLSNVKVNVHFSDIGGFFTPAEATDLQLTLTGPNGQSVILANGNGTGTTVDANGNGTGTNTAGSTFNDTIFDTLGGVAIGAAVSSPFTTVAPQQSLITAFGGLTDVNGTWTLTVTNLGTGGVLRLDTWSLVLQGTGPANTMDQNANGIAGEGSVVQPGKSSTAPLVLAGQPAPLGAVTVTANVQFTDPALAAANATSLQLRLRGPNGTSVLLANGNGTSTAGVDFANVIFSDAGTSITTATAPFGTVAPLQSLNTAFGMLANVNGTWTLTVTNLSTGSVVQLKSWALSINGVQVGTAQLAALDAFSNPTPAGGGVPFAAPYTNDSLPLIIPGPRVVSVSPGLTKDGAATYLDVTFSQDILGSSFTPAQVLELRSPTGQRVAGPFTVTANPPGTPIAQANRTYRIGFPAQVLSGYYSIVLSPDIRSATGLKMDPNMNAGVELVTGRVTDPQVASTVPQQYNTGTINVTVPVAADTNTPSVTTSVFPVADAFFLTQQLSTPIQVRLSINASDTRDITAQLIAPDGTVVQLFSNPGKSTAPFANFTNTILTDFALDSNAIANQGAPFTGTFLPQQQLSVLNGKFSLGDWTLRVTNRSTTAAATIVSWGLTLPRPVLGGGLGELVVDNTTVGFKVFTTNPNNVTSTTNWTPLGPTQNTDLATSETTNGIITVTAVDPTDRSGNTVYAGTANGGLWKTTNFLTLNPEGPIWIPLLDAASAKALRVSSIAIIPSNNNSDQSSIVIVGTGDADTGTAGVGFLRSVDGGNTFRLLDSTFNANPTPGADPTIYPVDSSGRDHIFSLNRSFVYKVVVDPVRQTNGDFYVYAAVGGDAAVAGVWRSSNSGRTWERLRAGAATDIVLAPNRVDVATVNGQPVSTLRNADVAYASFTGANGGVFSVQNITATAPVTFNLLTGGAGKPLFSNGITNIGVGNSTTNPNNAPTRILLTTVKAAANTDPLAVRVYQGWLYALVIGGGAPGLYVTKDFGANWTLVHLGSAGGRWSSQGTANLTNDETLPAFNYSTTPPVFQPVYNSLAVDPSDPNVVYLGGSNRVGSANGVSGSGNSGVYRVDISTLNDPHAQVGGDNSAGGVGPQTEAASTGGLTGGPTRIVTNGNGTTANNSAYFNRLRDPNNPFTSGSTQILNVPNFSQFVNNGFNAQISFFSGVVENDFIRNVETVFDPLTRKTRLLVSTGQGVFSAVDAANPLRTQGIYANAEFLSDSLHGVNVNGSTFDSIGTAISVSGNRSSNLALADITQTALQPSELAADLAGLYNRRTRDIFGNLLPANQQNSKANQWIYSISDQAYLNANGDILRPASNDYGADRWNGEVNTTSYLLYGGIEPWVYTGHVETDPQGSGTIYQYRPAPFALTDGAAQVDSLGNSTDVFSVTLPGLAPIGRSNGLFNIGLGDTATTGIWASTAKVDFAVNPADANGIVISAPIGGSVFLTNDQGFNWNPIGSASQFNSSQGVALAFGGRIPTAQPNDFIYNGTAEGKIWVTLNGGGLWTDISAGLPPVGAGAIQKIIPNPRGGTYEAYAITPTGVFYKSDARTATPWQDITSNVFDITRNVYGESTVAPLLTSLTALAVDWRYTQPVLYVGGDSGVYQSTNGGANWVLYPSALTPGVTADGGYLPTVRVTDLDLVYGNLNQTGVPDQTTSRNVLVASTYGRGLYAIRLDPTSVPSGAGTLGTSGPWVNGTPALAGPAAVNAASSLTVNFGDGANPVKVDQTTLNPQNLLIVAPNGSYIPYTVTDISALAANGIDSLANSFRLDFTPTVSGNYQLLLSTGVRDTSGRAMNQDRDGMNGEIPEDWSITTYAITVNQAPTISTPANVGLPINNGASTPQMFTVDDAETAPAALIVTRTSSNTALLPVGNIVLGGSGANRTVTVTPAAGQTGVATVTLTVTDGGGRQTSTTFTVSVAVATIPFSDNFNRADAPNLGGQWTTREGTVEESFNAALATSSPAVATLTAVSQLNSAAQATVSLSSSGANGSSGLVARYGGTAMAPTDYLGAVVQENGIVTARIIRQENGVATELSRSAALPVAPQYMLRFDVVNDALKLFVNDTLVTFAYDPVLTVAGETGIRFTSGNRLDDYSADHVNLLPVVLPAVPGTSATDAFTQADGTQLSRFWQDRLGNLSVTGNAVTGKANNSLSTYNIPPTVNAGAQANVAYTATNQTVGLVARYSGTATNPLSNFYWGALTSLGNGQQYVAIYKFNAAGSASLLASAGIPGNGGLLRFEANGGSLKLFLDGNLVLSGFDGAPLPAGVVGLLASVGGSADNFNAFALGTNTTLPFTDPFNAGNPGNQLSSVWTQQAGSFDLTNNTAAATGPGGNTATLNGVNAANVAVTATFKTPSNITASTGLVARYSGVGESNFYWATLNPFGNGVPGYSAQIWKVVNGAGTLLNANSFPLSDTSNPSTTNAVLRFEVFGSSLKLFINDQLASYAFDTSLTTGSVGVRSVAGSQIDDFNAALLSPVSPGLPFSDAFANNPPRNTLAPTWQERSGYFNVAGGAATGGESAVANVATLNGLNAADVVVTGTFNTPANITSATGLLARYTGMTGTGTGDDNYYWAALAPFGNGTPGYSAQIIKVVNGVATVLNANSFPLSDTSNPSTTNAVLRFEVVGSSLKLFLNDALVSFATDTALTSGSVGIRTRQGGSIAAFSAAVRSPVTPTLPFTDTFDSGLNPQNTLATTWSEQAGYFSVATDRAVGNASLNLATLNGVNTADATIDGTFFFTAVNQVGGLVGRYGGPGDSNLYLATVVTTSGGGLQLYIMKNIGGNYSVLNTTVLNGYFPGGDFTAMNPLLQFKLLGSQLTLSVDGVPQLMATDTSLTTGSVGVRQTQGVAVDAFTVTSP